MALKTESRMVYIYGLWDPRDSRLRYIGKTINLKSAYKRQRNDKGQFLPKEED